MHLTSVIFVIKAMIFKDVAIYLLKEMIMEFIFGI